MSYLRIYLARWKCGIRPPQTDEPGIAGGIGEDEAKRDSVCNQQFINYLPLSRTSPRDSSPWCTMKPLPLNDSHVQTPPTLLVGGANTNTNR